MKLTSTNALFGALSDCIQRFCAMLRLAGVAVAATMAIQVLQAESVVIAHKSTSADALQSLDMQQVFLGKKTNFPDGRAIKFAVLRDGPAHESFLTTRVKKQPSQFSHYWKTAVFSGKGKMPPEMASEADMAKYVSETPGAVGYVSREYADANDLSATCSVAR